MQKDDYDWFLKNYNALYAEYGQKYLAIKNHTVLGTYASYAEAVRNTEKKEELGTFIVQLCNGDETAYTNYIATLNLAFA